MEFAKSIDKDGIGKLPLKRFEGTIHVVSDLQSFYHVLPHLKLCPVLGFDTETKPSFKKGVKNKVALLQLSSTDEAFLFRLNKIGLPNELVQILADSEVVKVGAAIRDDIKSLIRLKKFSPNGFIDLQSLVQELGFVSFSLKKLSAIVLGFRISKSQQLSNWEADELTEKQAIYAATDAWVSLKVYLGIKNNKH